MPAPANPITSASKIEFMGSPSHRKFNTGLPYNRIIVLFWVWTGELTDRPATESFRIEKSKVTSTDDGILVDFSEFIAPYIKPIIDFDASIEVLNEGVFYQFSTDFFLDDTFVDNVDSDVRFATLGYNWFWEGETNFNKNHGSFGFYDESNPQYYYPYIKYYEPEIILTGATSTETMIKRNQVFATLDQIRCPRQPVIILYRSKSGLYRTFNVTGAVEFKTEFEREQYQRSVRDAGNRTQANRSSFHSTKQYNISSKQSYTINTGLLTEPMGQQVEEIIHSDDVYLIVFDGELRTGPAITIDSTVITVDNTIITIDQTAESGTVTPFYQVPVNVTSSDFVRRTRVADKANIVYTITLEDSHNKKNSLR